MNLTWLLQYPVWNLEFWGGGFLIALIAIIHVYIAHFAVGGGLFLVLTEMKGYRENSKPILEYTRKHTKLFLLLSMVLGGITGVGIWFTISLLSPSATSTLVHTFAFGWATEWVFFVGEIVTLFVYFYTFGKMKQRDHVTVGWLYFIFGWLSLFVINGIIGFMLTPGKWLQTKHFWDGFFNPSFFPSLFFRTAIAFMLAGLFGFITSVFIKEEDFRLTMVRYCAWWVLIPFVFLLGSGWWYLSGLPEFQREMILKKSPEILPFLKTFLCLSPMIVIGSAIMAIRVPAMVKKTLAFVLLLIGLMYMGSFEWIREAGRRPYIIYGYSFSNAVKTEDIGLKHGAIPNYSSLAAQHSLLSEARWTKTKEINDKNQIEAGQELFRLLCISCHSVGGPINNIFPLTQKYSLYGMESMLDGMGKINEYMPPFIGNSDEKKALAAYLVKKINKKTEQAPPIPSVKVASAEIPSFTSDADEYVMLAWDGRGMYENSDCDSYFTLSKPDTGIYALLIKRGESPEKISDKVNLTWRILRGSEKGQKADGLMAFDKTQGVYTVKKLPVVPYNDDGNFYPYPMVSIEARDSATGNLLAETKAIVPVSTELGCKTCHGGSWRVNDIAGISSETAKDILSVHDHFNRTHLLEMAEKGQPKACSECHEGQGKSLNLSASIHGFHANYLTNRNADACSACHPAEGFTRGFRGIHRNLGLDCTNCHGKMEDHALSLLVGEKKIGKTGADRLIRHLNPRTVKSVENIEPRIPWINEPDCMNCHIDFKSPETDVSEFNRWTKSEQGLYHCRTDNAGIPCAACHGAVHAEYPAVNTFGDDNIPPRQYQKNAYPIGANKNCKVCHRQDMDESVHHPNMSAMFRN